MSAQHPFLNLRLTKFCFADPSLKQDAKPSYEAMAKKIRTEVFIDEQQVSPEEEWDGLEAEAHHWLVFDEVSGDFVATCRMRGYQQGCQTPPVAKLERIAVIKTHRGKGIGRLLILAMLETAKEEGFQSAYLHGQTHARTFYEKLGFEAEGVAFEEAGIEHIAMRCRL